MTDYVIDLVNQGPSGDFSLRLISSFLFKNGFVALSLKFFKHLARKNKDKPEFVRDYILALESELKFLDGITEFLRLLAGCDGQVIDDVPVREIRSVLDSIFGAQSIVPTANVDNSGDCSDFDLSMISSKLEELNQAKSAPTDKLDGQVVFSQLLMVIIRMLFNLGHLSVIKKLSFAINKIILSHSLDKFNISEIRNDYKVCLEILAFICSRPNTLNRHSLGTQDKAIVFGDFNVLPFVYTHFDLADRHLFTVPVLLPTLNIFKMKTGSQDVLRNSFVKFAGLVPAKSTVFFSFSDVGYKELIEDDVKQMKINSFDEGIEALVNLYVDLMVLIAEKRKSTVFGRLCEGGDIEFAKQFNDVLREKVVGRKCCFLDASLFD
ncbi:hypothetical protein GEMRC1_003861 [Eukaryota sp. GEM-RC1]